MSSPPSSTAGGRSISIKVAPPNRYRSRFPRITHKIALAGGKDFQEAGVEFGIQVRPSDSSYPAIRVNTDFWRLQYSLEENHALVDRLEFKNEGLQLSERLAEWKQEDRINRMVVADLSPAVGCPLSDALCDIRKNGSRYAFECTMATAIVRLFVCRRAVIGTGPRFEKPHEADACFNKLYRRFRVAPVKGTIEIMGLSWLPDRVPMVLDALRPAADPDPNGDSREKRGIFPRPGDWIHFSHPFFSEEHPFSEENALYLGKGIIYAHDYGMLTLDKYLAQVQKLAPGVPLKRVEGETTAHLSLVGD